MFRSGRVLLPAAMLGCVCLCGGPALADALSDANALVIENPASVDLNLDYALIAEGQGKYRLALAAYERILLNHPDNRDAKRGLVRVRRIIQPPSTKKILETGTVLQSNAEHKPSNDDFDYLGFGRLTIKDERTVGETRWRSFGAVYGELHGEADSLNYATGYGTVGPLLDLGASMITLHPALGGGVAALDGDFYYADINVSATAEGYLDGAFQWARLRAGYRQYDEDVNSDRGFYLDATARIAKSDLFVENDSLSFAPMIRWNDIDGTFDDDVEGFSPGKYIYGGGRLAYHRVLGDSVVVGANIGVYDRYFLVDEAPNGDKRQDITVKPGATVLFRNVFGPQTGLRLNYDYVYNDSNDPDDDYQNHIFGLSIIARR